MPTRGKHQDLWPLVHIPTHNRSQRPVCCDETYASGLEGKPFSSGTFVGGERGPQLRKLRLGQSECGMPHMYVARVEGKRLIRTIMPVSQVFGRPSGAVPQERTVRSTTRRSCPHPI